jgi:hypothetical protein
MTTTSTALASSPELEAFLADATPPIVDARKVANASGDSFTRGVLALGIAWEEVVSDIAGPELAQRGREILERCARELAALEQPLV